LGGCGHSSCIPSFVAIDRAPWLLSSMQAITRSSFCVSKAQARASLHACLAKPCSWTSDRIAHNSSKSFPASARECTSPATPTLRCPSTTANRCGTCSSSGSGSVPINSQTSSCCARELSNSSSDSFRGRRSMVSIPIRARARRSSRTAPSWSRRRSSEGNRRHPSPSPRSSGRPLGEYYRPAGLLQACLLRRHSGRVDHDGSPVGSEPPFRERAPHRHPLAGETTHVVPRCFRPAHVNRVLTSKHIGVGTVLVVGDRTNRRVQDEEIHDVGAIASRNALVVGRARERALNQASGESNYGWLVMVA